MKRMVLIAGILLLAAAIFIGATAIYKEEYEKTEICREVSPDGEYVLVLYQVGSPDWSFGPVKAQLSLESGSGKQLAKEDMSLMNDGSDVMEGNILSVTWQEDRVEILMREFDTTKQETYSLFYCSCS